jgi:hypothetical protein
VTTVSALLQSQYPSVPVFYENTKQIDLVNISEKFIKVTIDFEDAYQFTMNDTPLDKIYGNVSLEYYCKEGYGSKSALEFFDFMESNLKYQTINGVYFTSPRPGDKESHDGWMSFEINVSFFFVTML